MSRVLDFRDLRERILAGEEEADLEPIEDTPLQIEGGEGLTLVPLCLSAGVIVYLGYESYQNAKGSPTLFSEPIRNMILIVGGVLPLGFGIGRLSRGLSAQKDNKKYDRLLDEADAKIEELEEEAQEAEEEAETEKEAETESQGYQLDYLSANDSSHHVPSLGFGLSAFGQEGVLFRPSVQESLW